MLGDNSTTNRYVPVQVKDTTGNNYLRGVVKVSAGAQHSSALRYDGTVVTWGRNHVGQLGNAGTVSSTAKYILPVYVKEVGNTGNLSNIIDFESGLYESIALKADGTAVTWGYNSNGQLGDNTTTNRSVPVVLKGEGNTASLNDIMLMAPGHKHMTVALENGNVYAWGISVEGEIGNDQTVQKNTPVCISYSEVVVDKPYVQFNTLETDEKVTPKLTPGFNILYDEIPNQGFTYESMNPSVATVDENGIITSHGEGNTFIKVTEIGSGIMGGTRVSVMPQRGNAFPMLVEGDNHTVALKADGTVWTWGRNNVGQLGLGDLDNRLEPTYTGIDGAIKVASGYDHTLVLKLDRNSMGIWTRYLWKIGK